MNIMEAKRNIGTSKSHSYTKENVLLAEKLLADYSKNQRHFDFDKIIETYNTIKGTTVAVSACKSCGGDKYIIAIRNYAKYGRMVLINEDPHTFDNVEKVVEILHQPLEFETERIQTGINEIIEEKQEEPKSKTKSKSKK